MESTRFLIVNADDFGLSDGVNQGIIEAHERGIVTSASLMVLKPAASAAANYSRNQIRLDVGLHLDLGEWAYDGKGWTLVDRVVPLDEPAVVAQELQRQLSEFRRMLGRNPTHLDSHQHAHRHEPTRSAAVTLARELGVPLREFSTGIQYCGRFYGQTTHGLALPEAISVESLMAILRNLPAGLTEISCHPGRTIGDALSYCNERSTEVDVLSHPQVRSLLSSEGIELRSFREPVNELRPADSSRSL